MPSLKNSPAYSNLMNTSWKPEDSLVPGLYSLRKTFSNNEDLGSILHFLESHFEI